MKNIDNTNLYNQVIDYIDEKYYFLNDKERRIFIVAYLSALRDSKIINDTNYIELLEELITNI